MSDTLRDPHDQKLAAEFHAIVAGWDDYDRCWKTNRDGTRCVRQATWLVGHHGHEPARRCGQHFRLLEKAVDAWVERNADECLCWICGGELLSRDQVITAVRL